MGAKESKEVDELIFEEEDAFVSEEKKDEEIRKEFRKLILYAESAEVNLQRRVAERLANEALDSNRQRQIVRLGGLDLLIPLCSSEDPEVRRLSVHALANLSSDHENQPSLEERGAIDIFMDLIKDRHPQTIRQSCKGLANLALNEQYRRIIVEKGVATSLLELIHPILPTNFNPRPSPAAHLSLKVEATACLANLAVDSENEMDLGLVNHGILRVLEALYFLLHVIKGISEANLSDSLEFPPEDTMREELLVQLTRALRNFTAHEETVQEALSFDTNLVHLLEELANRGSDRVSKQALVVVENLQQLHAQSK